MSANPNNGPAGPGHLAPEDLVLYAMQLFSSEDSAVVARHLEECVECRGELARIHGDLALCASTVDLQSPPEESRQRLMRQVAREKKIKIVPIAQPQPQPQAQGQPQRQPQPQAQPQAQPQPQPQWQPQPPIEEAYGRGASILSIEDRPRKHVGRIILAVAGWAVAAALAVAVTFQYKDREALRNNLASQAGELQRLSADAASAHQLMDALIDPKAVRVSLTPKPQPKALPSGGVTYNPEKGRLIFLASNLDPLQAYKTYELWVIPADGSAPIPAGTFHPDDRGNASVIMPLLPKGVAAKAFGVTIEADGGSPTPTAPIIMAGG
jgi:Anti-sigma-K factor rskA